MLKSVLSFTIGILTILARFYPALIAVVPVVGVVLSILAMRNASKFQIFVATLSMAVCIVGIVITLIPRGVMPS